MSRRIEVELTSRRDDGSWTWRAAGARQPKGVLDGGLLPSGAGTGDVLRVEADFDVDGIFVTQVLPPKARSGRPEAERIELIGRPQRGEGATTTTGARGRGGSGQRDGRGRPRKSGSGSGREADQRKRRRREGDSPDERSETNEGETQAKRKRRHDDARPKRDRGRQRAQRGDAAQPSDSDTERPSRPKARKLRPGRKHRDALLASLPAEQQVVAEQLARGGLAAVRTEIETQNSSAAEQGQPEVPLEGVLALAESLVGPMQSAEWRDRADAAIAGIDRVDLRDLRSVLVAAEDYARDAEAREIAEQIRAGLNERVERSQREWHDELRVTLADGRVVRALRLSSRPPKAGAPLPPEIAEELTTQANAALGTGASQHRIAVVLEAVAFSPVRPYVVLPSIPSEPTEELLDAVRKVANRLPEIAKALGIDPAATSPRSRPRRGAGRRTKSDAAKTDLAEAEADGSGEAAADAEPAPSSEPDERSLAGSDEAADETGNGSDAEDVAVEEAAHPA